MTFTDSFKCLRNKTVAVDIDGTICTEERTFERSLAKPLPGAREALSLLRRNGNTVILYTARGWEQYRVTQVWLRKHRMQYDQLIMGKPIANIWIDDRARRFTHWTDVEI